MLIVAMIAFLAHACMEHMSVLACISIVVAAAIPVELEKLEELLLADGIARTAAAADAAAGDMGGTGSCCSFSTTGSCKFIGTSTSQVESKVEKCPMFET